MQKSGYVNNLVDMREQLRRNYRNAEDIPAPAVSAPAMTVPSRENRLDAEAQRDARDLEGRLLSALATAQSNADLLHFRQQELSARIEKLRALMAEMEALDHADPANFRNKIDHLRYRFFEIAVEESAAPRTAAADIPERASLHGAWIVAGAILLGALIAAGAFFFSF